jgi:crooked neck
MQVYERAVGNVPLPLDAPEKRYWQRYIYLWLNYALWEEMEAEDPARTREVYRNCLKLIPHRLFTFAKVGGRPCSTPCSSAHPAYGAAALQHSER